LKIQTTIFTRRNASNPKDISTLDVPLTSVLLSDPSAPSDPPGPSDVVVVSDEAESPGPSDVVVVVSDEAESPGPSDSNVILKNLLGSVK